jgi:hypothetical protein
MAKNTMVDVASNQGARIKAIINSEEGKALPALANHLAFETSSTSESAIAAMKFAKRDIAAARAAGMTTNNHDNHAALEQPKAAAGWSKAVENANRQFATNEDLRAR